MYIYKDGKHILFNRSDRARMAHHSTITSAAYHAWPAAQIYLACHPQCDLLRATDRLPVAVM